MILRLVPQAAPTAFCDTSQHQVVLTRSFKIWKVVRRLGLSCKFSKTTTITQCISARFLKSLEPQSVWGYMTK